MMKPSIQQLLNSHFDNYRSQVGVSFDQARAIRSIKVCRTQSLGAHISTCDAGHVLGVWYNSCKHQLALLLLVKRSTQFKHLTALDVRVNIAVQQGTSYMFIVHQFTSFLKGTLFKKCFFLRTLASVRIWQIFFLISALSEPLTRWPLTLEPKSISSLMNFPLDALTIILCNAYVSI